jgi:hypothetical protein
MVAQQHNDMEKELELAPPARSVRTRRDEVAARLREAGAGRLSDSFLLPPVNHVAGRAAFYATRVETRWRDHSESYYVRTADVPFNLIPKRRAKEECRGIFFSLGPGLTLDGRPHPAVLLLQVEDSLASPLKLEGVDAVLSKWLLERRESLAETSDGLRSRCIAGLIPLSEFKGGHT